MSTTATTGKNQWENKELGVLWKKVKKGTTEKYLTGTINLKNAGLPDKDVALIVFSNRNKTKDTHPDLRIFISEKKTDSSETPKKTPTTAPAKAAPVAAAPADDELI